MNDFISIFIPLILVLLFSLFVFNILPIIDCLYNYFQNKKDNKNYYKCKSCVYKRFYYFYDEINALNTKIDILTEKFSNILDYIYQQRLFKKGEKNESKRDE